MSIPVKQYSLCPFRERYYNAPAIYPNKGQHPRVLFTAGALENIKSHLDCAENRHAYKKYLQLSEQPIDGMLRKPAPGKHNMSFEILAIIEAKAFRYALTKEAAFAQQAVEGIKQYIKTLFIPDGTLSDSCRAFGYTMYITACVYDWCYDFLTLWDKEELVAGCETLLAPHLEIGMPPIAQGAFVGHGTEAQLLRDWLALAIATFDEYPDIYELVAGRIFYEYQPVTNFFLQSGSHWQGSSYGPYRLYFLLYAQHLVDCMTQGRCELFSSDLHNAALAFLHYLRPDGQALRIGDDFNEYGNYYALNCYDVAAFLAACLYQDPILKGFAKTCLKDFSTFSYANNSLSPVMFLIFNQPSLRCGTLQELPRYIYHGSPLGSCIMRTGWEQPNAAMVYMKIGESYTANHEHKDAGSFQIYYRGILASNSGIYDAYFSPHDIAYNKQTISVNSLLLLNPEMKGNGKWVYSGGQTIQGIINDEHLALATWQSSPAFSQGKVLAHAHAENFCYLSGDITRAYDAQTAQKVIRSMLAVTPNSSKMPLLFFVYDDLVTRKASYKKTFLLHAQQKPEITSDGFVLVQNTKNGNNGMLIVQSCAEPTDITLIAGCPVNGTEMPLCKSYPEDSVCEIGWGRVEISPRHTACENRLLTVMYACDACRQVEPMKAEPLETPKLLGAALQQVTVLFLKDIDSYQETLSFTCTGTGEQQIYLAGLAEGVWKILRNGTALGEATVTADGRLLHFSSLPGELTIIPLG